MVLIIENPKQLDLTRFCQFLIKETERIALNEWLFEEALIKRWDEYFQNHKLGWIRAEDAPTTESIIRNYFNNLRAEKSSNGDYSIAVDRNIKLPKTGVSYDTLARIINEGTLSTPRYTIFEDIFKYIADNLAKLYEQWSK